MRVLLIEDDEILGDGLRAGIEQTGWVVDWVLNADQAQRALEIESFHLAVLDLGLPKRPGIEVLRWLRQRRNPVPVLILTANDGVEDRVTALDAGADDYVCKPFDLNELCARLRALHRRAVGCASPVIRHGQVEIDTAVRSVRVDGALIPLTPKEFTILQELAENIGKTVLRRRLESSMYGWNDAMGSNVVEVHLHHLRKKVPSLTVTTVRGVGYRLE
jgi:DNA-binding response OmpR family regulator